MPFQDLAEGLKVALDGVSDGTLGVAVSGGGDSMALLHMLAKLDIGVQAVTVDHDLRDESAAEAAMVANFCDGLGVPHSILKWDNRARSGNLQAAARVARLTLIADWAKARGITDVALGHTLDDQAETVLMRLLRGSGVDGLAGMAARREDGAVSWVRPLLHARRSDLRLYLESHGVGWVDDPTNDDMHYARVRVRKAMNALGIDPEGLATTADRMRGARHVLERDAARLADACVICDEAGEVTIAAGQFFAAPDELQLRLLAGVLRWVSGGVYRPRFESLRALQGALESTTGRTLHGCVVRARSGKIVVRREVSKVMPPCDVAKGAWDGRWTITALANAYIATHIGALGAEGLSECVNWRETGHSREVLEATPALWNKGHLVAAPLAGMANGWLCELSDAKKGIHKVLITR